MLMGPILRVSACGTGFQALILMCSHMYVKVYPDVEFVPYAGTHTFGQCYIYIYICICVYICFELASEYKALGGQDKETRTNPAPTVLKGLEMVWVCGLVFWRCFGYRA